MSQYTITCKSCRYKNVMDTYEIHSRFVYQCVNCGQRLDKRHPHLPEGDPKAKKKYRPRKAGNKSTGKQINNFQQYLDKQNARP